MCYLAHSVLGEPVVIKRFKPAIFKKNREKNAFEAVVLSQLTHESIPELLGVINEKGFYGFVLEYKEGLTVKDLLFKRMQKFTQQEFYQIGVQLINIIKYIHGMGIVHRDIRISNVIINVGKVSLIDFGLSRWADDKNYLFNCDFSYLGDFLLYLLYSSYERKSKAKNLPWHKELPLTSEQTMFLKKLLRLEKPYENIEEIEKDFVHWNQTDSLI